MARSASQSKSVTLLVATRKGAFMVRSDPARAKWKLSAPIFLGHIVHHMVADPRSPGTILMAARTGHLGPTVFRSGDAGKTWKEAAKPPAFAAPKRKQPVLTVDHTFWLEPGLAADPGVWYAGTSPPGLFRSADGGDAWEPVAGFNEHPDRVKWVGDSNEGPPGGATLHSISIDPRDGAHMYIGLSAGGVCETSDAGRTWKPLNAGCAADFLPDPNPEYGHDPHCLRLHPLAPDTLYQQNHCGSYRMHRPEGRWERIGANMPAEVGDIGFPIALHPRDPETLWVFPMDGSTVWPRVSPGGKPAAYRSTNGGRTWTRQARGLPPRDAWWNVKRQALATDTREPLGVYFGTTNGEVYASADEGRWWNCIARHLPEVFAVEAL